MPLAQSMVTLLVSTPNPAPLSCSELSTIISRFLVCSLRSALACSSCVSKANPTNSRSPFVLPNVAAMSVVVVRSMDMPVCPGRFLIFLSAVLLGVKSATAAQRMAMSACSNASTWNSPLRNHAAQLAIIK